LQPGISRTIFFLNSNTRTLAGPGNLTITGPTGGNGAFLIEPQNYCSNYTGTITINSDAAIYMMDDGNGSVQGFLRDATINLAGGTFKYRTPFTGARSDINMGFGVSVAAPTRSGTFSTLALNNNQPVGSNGNVFLTIIFKNLTMAAGSTLNLTNYYQLKTDGQNNTTNTESPYAGPFNVIINGATTLNGAATINTGFYNPLFLGTVTANGTLTLGSSTLANNVSGGTVDIGSLTGAGGLTINSGSTCILSGTSNGYSGATTVNSGCLNFYGTANSTTSLTVNGGIVRFRGTRQP